MLTAVELGRLSALEKIADLAEDFKVPELRSTLDFYKKETHKNDIDLNRLKAIPTPSENARNSIAYKLDENDWYRQKINLINEQVGAMQPNQQPPQEQPKAPNQGGLMSYLKNPYVLGGLGIGALGLGGYGLYHYLNPKKKKKPDSE